MINDSKFQVIIGLGGGMCSVEGLIGKYVSKYIYTEACCMLHVFL